MVLTWYFLLKTILVLILAARHPTVSQRKQLTPILPDQCHYFAWMLCISCVISVYFAHCYVCLDGAMLVVATHSRTV